MDWVHSSVKYRVTHKRMRLKRRLYRIYTVYFLIFRILCNFKLVSFFAMSITNSRQYLRQTT